MAWVIWLYNEDKDRREYVRRITPRFVSYSLDFADARRFDTKGEARAALKGTGLTVGKVKREDGADVEPDDPADREPGWQGRALKAAGDRLAADNADDGPPFT